MVSHRRPEYLISAAALRERISAGRTIVLDVTTTIYPTDDGPFKVVAERETFERGHISGAQFVDLQADASRNGDGLLFTLPDMASFAALGARLGIGRDTFVVVYSTRQMGWAARFWLMLRAFGFENAAILNGGLEAWRSEGFPLETGPASAPAPVAHPFPWIDRSADYFVGTKAVLANVAGGDAVLINALPTEIFNGDGAIVYGRRGHIPGSVNLPTASLTDEANYFLDGAQLEARFSAIGLTPESKIIAYCGAGIAASNVAFARLLMGHDSSAVYDGSMLEWSSDASRPVVKSDD